jgi:DMSO reductase anchor subunit
MQREHGRLFLVQAMLLFYCCAGCAVGAVLLLYVLKIIIWAFGNNPTNLPSVDDVIGLGLVGGGIGFVIAIGNLLLMAWERRK